MITDSHEWVSEGFLQNVSKKPKQVIEITAEYPVIWLRV